MRHSLTTLALPLLLLSACLAQLPPDAAPTALVGSLTPTSKGERLTPTSKGERLTPTSKGERRGEGRLSGRLLLQNSPVAAALVRIEGTGLEATTDSQGAFSLAGLPQDGQVLNLLAEKADADGRNYRVRVPAEAPEQVPLDVGPLMLSPTGGISGRVQLSDGAEPGGILVSIPGSDLATRTDSRGTFSLSDVPAGSYRLRAAKAGYRSAESATLRLDAGQTIRAETLYLLASAPAGTASLSGHLESGGQPVAGARLMLSGADPNQALVTLSERDGAYAFEGIDLTRLKPLASGNHELLVIHPAYPSGTLSLKLRAGEALERELELEPAALTPGRLDVEVHDCAGKPVPTALIQLDPAPALGPVPFTDLRGHLRLGPLPPGKYTVYAAKGERLDFTGIVVENRPLGSDGKPGALAKARLVLGAPCTVAKPTS